jgi:hypothetical protein
MGRKTPRTHGASALPYSLLIRRPPHPPSGGLLFARDVRDGGVSPVSHEGIGQTPVPATRVHIVWCVVVIVVMRG